MTSTLKTAVLVLVLILNFQLSASGQISNQAVSKLVFSSGAVGAGTKITTQRAGGLILIELQGNNLSNLKQKAFVIGRSILHSDPGYVRAVITRFYTHNQSGYTDCVVTSKDITGVDAGIENKQSVMAKVPSVSINFNESANVRFGKYLNVARALQQKGEIYPAQYFFSFAQQQDKVSALRDPGYIRGLFDLAKSFEVRGDVDQVYLAYDQILTISQGSTHPVSLDVLRQVASYFKNIGDYDRCLKAATLLVDADKKSGITGSKYYVDDVRIYAFCLRKSGKLAEAKQHLEAALSSCSTPSRENVPKMAQLLEDLGDCYLAEGNSGQAFSFYKQAKNKYDSSMAHRKQNMRVDYETYRSAMRRLRDKIRNLDKTG